MSLEQAQPFEEKKIYTVQGNLLMEQSSKRRIIYDRFNNLSHCCYINDGKFNFREESYTQDGSLVFTRVARNLPTSGIWQDEKKQESGNFIVRDNLMIDFHENTISAISILDDYNVKRETVSFYKSGRPEYYYKHDGNGKGFGVSLKDKEGSPLNDVTQAYYGNVHGVGASFNNKAVTSVYYNIIDDESLTLDFVNNDYKNPCLLQYYPSSNLKYIAFMDRDESKIEYGHFPDKKTKKGTKFQGVTTDFKTGDVLQQSQEVVTYIGKKGMQCSKDGLDIDFEQGYSALCSKRLNQVDTDMFLLQALPIDVPDFHGKCAFISKQCQEHFPLIAKMVNASQSDSSEEAEYIYETFKGNIHMRIDHLKDRAGLTL